MLRLVLIGILLELRVGYSTAEERRPVHLLDPLTWQEHWAVLKIPASAGQMNDDTDFSRVAVEPPSKEVIWAWPDGPAPARQAEVMLNHEGDVAKLVVDIGSGEIVSFAEVDGQLTWLQYEDDSDDMLDIVQSDKRCVAAMNARRIEFLQFVSCTVVSYVNFEIEEYEDRRVGAVTCDYMPDAQNIWPRNIPGIDILVDLDEELYVPCLSPKANYYSATYFDVGDYSAGGLPNALVPGLHRPSSVSYLDMIIAEDDGQPEDVRRAACLFERSCGDVELAHDDYAIPKREFVARSKEEQVRLFDELQSGFGAFFKNPVEKGRHKS